MDADNEILTEAYLFFDLQTARPFCLTSTTPLPRPAFPRTPSLARTLAITDLSTVFPVTTRSGSEPAPSPASPITPRVLGSSMSKRP